MFVRLAVRRSQQVVRTSLTAPRLAGLPLAQSSALVQMPSRFQLVRAFSSQYTSSVGAVSENDDPKPFTGILPDETVPRGRRAPALKDFEPMNEEEFDQLDDSQQIKRILDMIKICVEPAQGLLLTDLKEFPAPSSTISALQSMAATEFAPLADSYDSLDQDSKVSMDLFVRFMPNSQDEATIASLKLDEDDVSLLRLEFLKEAILNSAKFYSYNDEFLTREEILQKSYFTTFGEEMSERNAA